MFAQKAQCFGSKKAIFKYLICCISLEFINSCFSFFFLLFFLIDCLNLLRVRKPQIGSIEDHICLVNLFLFRYLTQIDEHYILLFVCFPGRKRSAGNSKAKMPAPNHLCCKILLDQKCSLHILLCFQENIGP